MKLHRRAVIAALALLALAPSTVRGQDKPTRAQAREVAERAAELLATQGVDKARPLLHAEGPFRFGEIYVNVIDLNGTWLIYPPNPRNEGKSVLNVRDLDGKFLVQDIIALARGKGDGWIDYRWLNPANNAIEQKSSFVKLVPEISVITYVGVYGPP